MILISGTFELKIVGVICATHSIMTGGDAKN
jgi:hypothetical protein